MRCAHIRPFAQAAVLLVAAIPLTGQAAGTPAASDESAQWAHPHVMVRPAPASAGVTGFGPSQMRRAYGFNLVRNQAAGQRIALIDAYDNPNAESDLGVFTRQFGLPPCTSANGCFQVIYASGVKPAFNSLWALESSLDTQWSYAIAPRAKILLVEAADQSSAALWHAVDVAIQHGATVVSMSFGFWEYARETAADVHFNVPGVTFCASSGDGGHNTQYPAASPYVVSVGGTTLQLGSGGAWQSEAAWNGSGGGASRYEIEPSYQAIVQTMGRRGIPDVAFDADPNTGVAVYSQSGYGGWAQVGGTSVGTPQWAALFAIANSMRVAAGKTTLTQPQLNLYASGETDYHDITSGANGSCGAQCTAAPGYDFLTGLGSPQANLLIPMLVNDVP
jgi:subtilase family serine protease